MAESSPVSGKRVSKVISGTVWLLLCSEPKVTLGMRPKGLIAGLICFSPARGPGDTKVPFAGQALGGAQLPSAANRSYCFWIAAYARGPSAGPNSSL